VIATALLLASSLGATSTPAAAATYVYSDVGVRVTLELLPDGACHVSTLDKSTMALSAVRCTYWIHGSRIRLRVRGEVDGTGFNALDIERVPQTDAVIFHGAHPARFTRQPAMMERC
jgi:hypothetical protein